MIVIKKLNELFQYNAETQSQSYHSLLESIIPLTFCLTFTGIHAIRFVRRKTLRNGYQNIPSDQSVSKPDIPFYEKTLEDVDYPSLLKAINRSELLVTIATVLQTLNYATLISWRLLDLFKGHQDGFSPYEWARLGCLLIGWVSWASSYATHFFPILYQRMAKAVLIQHFLVDLRIRARTVKVWKETSISQHIGVPNCILHYRPGVQRNPFPRRTLFLLELGRCSN